MTGQVVHFKHNLTQQPVCKQFKKMEEVVMSQDLDEVNCVGCLRDLLKSAGRFGNEGRVSRKTTYGRKAR